MFSLAAYWSPPSHRTISQIVSSIRKISKNKSASAEYQHQPQSTLHGHIKLDTHADMMVLGSNCIVLSYTAKECEVSPYSSQYEAVRNVPDMIYIKTQVFRLSRYYSPAHRNIARSVWATQNITHNMTSSIT